MPDPKKWSNLAALRRLFQTRAGLDTAVTALDANAASALRVQQDARHLSTTARGAASTGRHLRRDLQRRHLDA